MAIYHCSVKIIGRGQGRSAVGAAAYRSGEKLINDNDGLTHDYTKKGGITYTEIMLCKNAPQEYQNRETLWNAVEKSERDSGARLAREIEVALPVELTRQEQIQLVRDYVHDNFVKHGMCADISIHDKKDGNPHAHIMLTVRPIDDNGKWENKFEKVYICKNQQGEERGFTAKELKGQQAGEWEKQLPYYKNGNPNSRAVYLKKAEAETDPKYKSYERVKGKNDPKKSREDRENPTAQEWNKNDTLERWREQWAIHINRELEKKNLPDRVDHRSYDAQGIDKIPTQHLGVSANQMERRGIQTERGEENREIKRVNDEIRNTNDERNYIIGRIEQSEKWRKAHEITEKVYKRISEKPLSENAYVNLLVDMHRLGLAIRRYSETTDYHKDNYYIDKNGERIGYQKYHTEKAQADIAVIRSNIEKNLAEIERRRQEQASRPQAEKPSIKTVIADAQQRADEQNRQRGEQAAQGNGGDRARVPAPATPTGAQDAAARFDIAGAARQLEAHRAEFIKATAQAAGRTEYRENPIYRQQAAQIQSCVKTIKEQTASIDSLKEQKNALGLFQGKQKKELDNKIGNFERYRREQQAQLKALGVSEPSQADRVIKERLAQAAQEKQKEQAAQESKGAGGRAAEEKAAFLDLARSVPDDKRQAVIDEMERNRDTKGGTEKGLSSLHQYQAEIEARQSLDTALKPQQAREQSRTHDRKHDRGRDRD